MFGLENSCLYNNLISSVNGTDAAKSVREIIGLCPLTKPSDINFRNQNIMHNKPNPRLLEADRTQQVQSQIDSIYFNQFFYGPHSIKVLQKFQFKGYIFGST